MSKSGPILAARVYDLEKKLEEALELEAFWKRAAEQALRLWDASQDRQEFLLSVIRRMAPVEGVSTPSRLFSCPVTVNIDHEIVKDRYGLFEDDAPEAT